jgi:hypothetical protein
MRIRGVPRSDDGDDTPPAFGIGVAASLRTGDIHLEAGDCSPSGKA